MGTFGTRPLVERGAVGRLNVFCEPTGLRFLPRATASMTACVRVRGQDAVDDTPGAGHNATALLGHLAQHLARTVPPRLAAGTGMCLAGLRTGEHHNRVYGSGTLLLNVSYDRPAAAREAERVLERAVRDGVEEFRRRFAGLRDFARTAADAASITTVRWLKRGLPALGGQPAWGGELFERAGIPGWPADAPAFTCDAIWMQGVPGTYTAVYGPGRLDANHAHAEGEFADLADLEAYAAGIARLLAVHTATVTGTVTGTETATATGGGVEDHHDHGKRLLPGPRRGPVG